MFIALASSVALLSASGTSESASVLSPVAVTEPMADGFGQGMTARPDGVEARWVEFDNDLPTFYSRTSTDFGQTFSEPVDITAEYDHRSPSDDDAIFSYTEAITEGHIYQTWTDGGILFRRSDDDGVTWMQPVLVDSFGPFFEASIFPGWSPSTSPTT